MPQNLVVLHIDLLVVHKNFFSYRLSFQLATTIRGLLIFMAGHTSS